MTENLGSSIPMMSLKTGAQTWRRMKSGESFCQIGITPVGPPMTGMLVVSLWVMSGGKKMQKRKVCGGDGSKEKAGQGSETKLFLGIS